MLILNVSELQGGDGDRFDAEYQDFTNSTGRVQSAWIQDGCRKDAEHVAHTVFCIILIDV